MENPSIVENLEWSVLLFKIFNLQNSGIPCNSGKIPTDGGVHYYEVYYIIFIWLVWLRVLSLKAWQHFVPLAHSCLVQRWPYNSGKILTDGGVH